MTAMKSGLQKCPFLFSIKKTYPRSWLEILARAKKYANAEEGYDAHPEPKEPQAKEKPMVVLQPPPAEESIQATGRELPAPPHERRPRSPPRRRCNRSHVRGRMPPVRYLTPLNSSREAILIEIGTQFSEP